jgi:L-lactate dehydrogenase complex protein LldF
MSPIDVEALAQAQPAAARASVRAVSERKVNARQKALAADIADIEGMRLLAAELRQHTLDHLDQYLEQAEKALQSRGVRVHWAQDAEEARNIVAGLCKAAGAQVVSKAKSMVTEEIELNAFLESLGYQPFETDLGEFVVQLAKDRPSHIVTPIMHMNGREVARIFEREGLGPYTEDPEKLTMMARRRMRSVFRDAVLGITGANYITADTGRIILLSNEGNIRFTLTAPRVHIALTGIEKVIAREEELAVLLKLHARSATGQDLTVYTQFAGGPRRRGDPDGPEEVHVVLLDNGRSEILGSRYHAILRCIRCGACLNVCPVYRAVTGHAYSAVYPGPMGSIYSPLLGGDEARHNYASLPKASSLCGACQEVCPVDIPIPEMLLGLREDLKPQLGTMAGTPPFSLWAALATRPRLWRTALTAGHAVGWAPIEAAPIAAFKAWLRYRELPPWPREPFRQAWRKRQKTKPKDKE